MRHGIMFRMKSINLFVSLSTIAICLFSCNSQIISNADSVFDGGTFDFSGSVLSQDCLDDSACGASTYCYKTRCTGLCSKEINCGFEEVCSAGGHCGSYKGNGDPPSDYSLLEICLNATVQKECASGYQIVIYSADPNDAGMAISFNNKECARLLISSAWNGWAAFTAICTTRAPRNWSSWVGMPASSAGISSIKLDGNELSDKHSLICNDSYSPMPPDPKPMIPLNSANFGKCRP